MTLREDSKLKNWAPLNQRSNHSQKRRRQVPTKPKPKPTHSLSFHCSSTSISILLHFKAATPITKNPPYPLKNPQPTTPIPRISTPNPQNFDQIHSRAARAKNPRIRISPKMEQPRVITGKTQMRNWSRDTRAKGKTIALVPTMGYLHEGHLSLVREARSHAQAVVVSIYVNPGQFSPSEDLSTYPSDFHGDLAKLAAVPGGVDAVFHPHNLYDYGSDGEISGIGGNGSVSSCVEERGLGHETWVRVERLEKGLCGKSRPVFFRGVATVVTKLFNIVDPDVALFGKKDYQQWRIVQRMVRDLDFSIKIIGSEIMRESDGLAMSSRNVHLSPDDRIKALSINQSLSRAKLSAEKGQVKCGDLRQIVSQAIHEAGGRIDYAEIVDQDSLEVVEEIKKPVVFCVAAWFGKVRLLDNIEINIL